MANHRSNKQCSEAGCDRPHKARGLCGLHYARLHYDDRREYRKGTLLQVHLTPEMRVALGEATRKAGISMSQWVRQALLHSLEEKRPPAVEGSALAEVSEANKALVASAHNEAASLRRKLTHMERELLKQREENTRLIAELAECGALYE